MNKRLWLLQAAALAGLGLAAPAQAQDFPPKKPVTLFMKKESTQWAAIIKERKLTAE